LIEESAPRLDDQPPEKAHWREEAKSALMQGINERHPEIIVLPHNFRIQPFPFILAALKEVITHNSASCLCSAPDLEIMLNNR